MDQQTRIILDPNILVGKPIVRGTRLAVEFIIDLLAQGWSTDEILRNYPGISLEDIQACLSYASYPTFRSAERLRLLHPSQLTQPI
jgi:uncharacterized protein (DUF433 family)